MKRDRHRDGRLIGALLAALRGLALVGVLTLGFAWAGAVEAVDSGAIHGQKFEDVDGDGVWDKSIVDWIRGYGSGGEDWPYAVAVASSGNIYAAGGTYGTLPGQTHLGDSELP